MSDMLSIGSSGVTAYQRALATVSNNIANVSTDGYSRQDVSVTANQPQQLGNGYIGTGARFDQVRRQFDAFVESNLRNSNSDLKAQEPLLTYVNRLIDVMGNESIGLTSAMNQFYATARELATDPASAVARTIFLRDSEGLAGRFRQLATQFEMLRTETRQSVQTDVDQVNALTLQLAEVNKQMTKKSSVADQPSELLDQRDRLLLQLSGLIGMKTEFATNGAVLVSVGDTQSQGILVKDGNAKAIGVSESSTDPSKLLFVLDAYGIPKSMPAITSGKIGGVMNFRDQVLAPAISALDSLAEVTVNEINAIHRDGIDAEGMLGGDLLGFTAGNANTAGGMVLLIQDTARVAAAGQFRVTDAPLNPGTAQARIGYSTPSFEGPSDLTGSLTSAQVPRIATVSLEMPASQGYSSVGLVRAGMKDVVLTLNSASEGQELQVLTRDGRHLLGTDLGSTADGKSVLDRVLRSANGFETGATYNNDQLNAGKRVVNGETIDDRYLDMDLFIGAKASVQQILQFNRSTGALIEPKLMPPVLQGGTPATDWLATISQAGRFTLDGQELQAPDPTSPPADLAQWIIGQGIPGITASVGANGELQITRADTTQDIRLGLGPAGGAADMKAIGFDTSVYIAGTSQDDLLVFVTDTTRTQSASLPPALVTGQHEGQSGDIKQMLREQSLEVTFSKGDETLDEDPAQLYYTISESKSNTVLARRMFDSSTSGTPNLQYRGISLEFTTLPVENDVFRVDGNKDGVGNNEAMLRMVALEQKKVMPNGQTMTEAYIERVNRVGSAARQATISKEALTVVNQQAQEAHDGVSGVSLDQEASDLVKYQQAYQANAKVMQVASSLFDAILQVQ